MINRKIFNGSPHKHKQQQQQDPKGNQTHPAGRTFLAFLWLIESITIVLHINI